MYHKFLKIVSKLNQFLYYNVFFTGLDTANYYSGLEFEVAKSASGWTSHKVHALKDRDGTEYEEEEQGTETRRSVPQNKIRKDGRPKCYMWAVSYTHLDVYKRQD